MMAYFARRLTSLKRIVCNTQKITSCPPTKAAKYWKHHLNFSQSSISRLIPSVTTMPMYSLRHMHTRGDKQLVEFLDNEILEEENSRPVVPNLDGFLTHIKDTIVTLKRNIDGEKIQIVFDVNDNLNVIESGEHEISGSNDVISELVSYPKFKVSITKPSGKVLLYHCTTQVVDSHEFQYEDDFEEERQELLSITLVQVYHSDHVDSLSTIYEADTEGVDGDLYSMLLNTLLERGIDGDLVNRLIDLSTTVDTEQHLGFLKNLREFAMGI